MDRLVEQVDKLREDIALTEAQLTAQLEETKAAREALSEASMEIEVRKYILELASCNSLSVELTLSTHTKCPSGRSNSI